MTNDDARTTGFTSTTFTLGNASSTAPPDPALALPPDLDQAELLGEGGMGQVYRVEEPELMRTVALKTLRHRPTEKPGHVDRFLREACTTAQLQHPGIIAIHSRGTLPDGRPYFTMPEIRGQELARLIESRYRDGVPSLRDLVRFVRRACEPLAYAHAHGVVHRDFKPENTMIGAHGEVLVLDWGLARRAEDPEDEQEPGELFIESPTLTRTGGMLGTPAYMSPEQITGRELSPRSDVYALGAVLYEVLNGHPPRIGTLAQVLNQTLTGAAPPPCAGPPTLASLAYACLSTDPSDRPADAAVVGSALEQWLEGARRTAEADDLVAQAAALAEEVFQLRDRAQGVETEASALLGPLGAYAPEVEKAPGWTLQDAAALHRREAERLHHRVEQVLWSAIARDEEHGPARQALATRFREDHVRAERAHDDDGVSRSQEALSAQLSYLSAEERSRHERYLEGNATLTLQTEPSGARVIGRRIQEHRRLLLEGEPVELGTTPLVDVPLAAGSWMLELLHEDRAPIRYPVHLSRRGTWSSTPPGATEPAAVHLPPTGSIGERFRYIPAGWFTAGGDPEAPRSIPETPLWCHSFVMKRDPVTNREYLEFLDDLVCQGRLADSRRYSPRDYHERPGDAAPPLWGRHDDGTWFIAADPDGDLWDPDWPVMMIDFDSSAAYAAWYAERTGLPWRLPAEFEWEKAARGVDRRVYPWGNHLDLTWASVEYHEGSSLTRAEQRPRDCSPYGIRQMGGVVAERCLEAHNTSLPTGDVVRVPELDLAAERRISRGGSWSGPRHGVRSATRGISPSNRGLFSLGFRIARSFM